MPQVKAVQCIYWSTLHPGPVELLPNSINTFVGPNGSCKTSFMDAIKLIFGVRKLFEERGPQAYVFLDPVTGDTAAPHALVKVTFLNAVDGAGRRPFGLIAPGMDTTDVVTAVCRIQRNGHREYILLPGDLDWTDTNRIDADLQSMRRDRLGTGFLTADDWNERVLRRIGVSRALQSVLAIDQFETASLTRKKPDELLDAILQIAGEQTTRQRYDEARGELANAEQEMADAERRLKEEELTLRELQQRRERHLHYVRTQREAQEYRRRERLARWRSAETSRQDLSRALETLAQTLATLRANIEEFTRSKSALEVSLATIERELAATRGEVDRLDHELRRMERDLGSLEGEDVRLAAELDSLLGLPELDVQTLLREIEELRGTHRDAVVGLADAENKLGALAAEIAELEAGRPLAPHGLRELVEELEHQGLHPAILGEHLRFNSPSALGAGAAFLGDRAWAIAVDRKRWREAKEIAAKRGTSCYLVVDTPGVESPTASPDTLGTACVLDDPRFEVALTSWGFSTTRVVQSWKEGHDTVAAGAPRAASPDGCLQAATDFRLDRGLALVKFLVAEQLNERRAFRPALEEKRSAAAQHESEVRAALSAVDETLRHQVARRRIPEVRAELADIGSRSNSLSEALKDAERSRAAAVARRDELQAREIKERAEFAQLDEKATNAAGQLKGNESRQDDLGVQLRGAVETLAQLALSEDEQSEAETEASAVEELRAHAEAAENLLKGFEEDIRGPEILADCDAQEQRVASVRNLVGGKRSEVERARIVCDQARRDYYEYLRRFGERLAASFREVCSDCGADGDLAIRGLQEDRPYLYVAVAHNRGERLISYRDTPHSGGQRSKLSMLLLIAAMGLDGSTDFMMLDEPTAHMSGDAIRQVNQLLERLVHTRGRRVQFVFAVPTKGENEPGPLLADQQILFFLRRPGETFSPPVVRMIRQVPEASSSVM